MRLTRPVALIRPQVEDLIEIYQGRNFPKQELVQLASLSLRSMGPVVTKKQVCVCVGVQDNFPSHEMKDLQSWRWFLLQRCGKVCKRYSTAKQDFPDIQHEVVAETRLRGSSQGPPPHGLNMALTYLNKNSTRPQHGVNRVSTRP